jgi:methyl-accepting chemotaxis protein
MWNVFKHLSVATRLKALVATSVATVIGVSAVLLGTMLNQQIDDRHQAVRQTVEVAHGLLAHYGRLADQGKLTTDDAQKQSLAALDSLRYSQKEYFWVNDLNARMVHHPIKPELNGKDVSQMKDPNGVLLFQAFVRTAKEQGEGFVHYQWPKPGHDAPVDKVSYVKAFAPWGWVVGSGVYTDDILHVFVREAGWVMACTLLCACVIGWLTLRTARRLSLGVAAAVQLAESIAQGDIRPPLHDQAQTNDWHEGRDELARLLQAMNRMSQGLRETVSSVQQTVDSVALASQQIAAGNQDLSLRTEQTAASLQQTASSMEELGLTVSRNSHSSQDAHHMAHEAFEQTRQGAAMVAGVVQKMDAIHDSARRISDIITVIDGIAFQTNILALNAAVEAARAGEQGRGFAVVASEVRSLAQRSANAAKEIKTLIVTSTEQVEGGNALVHEAGETMNRIEASVARVTQLVEDIARASREQNKGMGTVHQAVGSLDQMTQQNSALVEQSAAAAASLRDQAHALADVLRRFRVAG